MSRRKNEQLGSMDSLLDTMTNVVGILVILLVVTQLGVASAVKRIISSLPEVSEEELVVTQREFETAGATLEGLENQWASLSPKTDDQQRVLSQLEKDVATLEAAGGSTKPVASKGPDVRALNKSVAELDKKMASQTASIKKSQADLAKKKVRLSELPVRTAPKAKVVRVPNPRAATPGARGEWFICKNNRIIAIDTPKIAEMFSKRVVAQKSRLRFGSAKNSIAKSGLRKAGSKPAKSQPKPATIYDRLKLEAYFKKYPATISGHKVSGYGRAWASGCWIKLNVSMTSGESPAAIGNRLSKFQRTLKQVKTRKNFARFLVYTDSFEVYLKARTICERERVPAGWGLIGTPEWETWQAVPAIKLNITKPRPPAPPKDPTKKSPPKAVPKLLD